MAIATRQRPDPRTALAECPARLTGSLGPGQVNAPGSRAAISGFGETDDRNLRIACLPPLSSRAIMPFGMDKAVREGGRWHG